MSSSSLGRRYERLLFFAGPLAFASLLVLFVAVAIDQQGDRQQAKCLREGASLIEADKSRLEQQSTAKRSGRDEGVVYYSIALNHSLSPLIAQNARCFQYLGERFLQDAALKSPQMLIEQMRTRATDLEGKPLLYYGVELPEKASISLIGVTLKVELMTLVRSLQVALGPVLLLWLGCLYNTRHRESLYVSRMTDVKQLYPHLINVYPVDFAFRASPKFPRKRSWIRYHANLYGVPTLFVLIRVSLLSAFVGPPVAFYIISLLLVESTTYAWMFFASGLLVFLFAVGTYICEALPWHVGKRFRVFLGST